jgi:hypothetical protein
VLLLAHYNKGLDAEVPAGALGRATVRHARLAPAGQGVAFADSLPAACAADLGYSDPSPPDAAVLYDARNVETRQGTIQLWVKSRWAWVADPRPQTPVVHMFLGVPMVGGGHQGLYLYFAADQGHHFIPHLVFNIYDGRRDHVTNVNLGPNRTIPFDPQPHRWHYRRRHVDAAPHAALPRRPARRRATMGRADGPHAPGRPHRGGQPRARGPVPGRRTDG